MKVDVNGTISNATLYAFSLRLLSYDQWYNYNAELLFVKKTRLMTLEQLVYAYCAVYFAVHLMIKISQFVLS